MLLKVHNFSSIAGLAALLALLSTPALAQDYRARVQGTVTDSSAAVVSGAKVNLLNIKTGVDTVRKTGETGHFLFDMVEPGTYSLTVELQGFSKFLQENINVPSRADLTVDAVLKPGEIRETVSVTAEVTALQFNTAKVETTIDQKLTQSLPQLYRNVFLLAQLDPSVESTSWGEDNPYDTWASNNLRIGGSGQFTNDLQVDGSPSGISVKTGYVPSPDMVQEVNVLQNAVDAEYGHSSGSAISLVLKSGTNEYHGTGFFQAQRKEWNALENRVYRSENQTRNNMYGATFGGPILKNKLFNFVGYEAWDKTEPAMLYNTVPTDLERTGDFSATMTDEGTLRPIYDPWTTQTAADGTITRTPFPGNVIPSSRINSVAQKYTAALWKANHPGIDAFNTNNFVVSTPIKYPYKNFSDRVDYAVNDKLRIYGRGSLTRTPVQVTGNPTGSPMFMSDRGADYNMTSYAGDATYALNASTVLNVHGGYHNFKDTSHFATQFDQAWSWQGVFPDSNFYSPVFADPSIPKLIPRMSICNQENTPCTHMGPGGGYWHETPHAWEFSAKVAQQRGAHYLKTGADIRRNTTNSLILNINPGFGFDGKPTSATYNNPNLLLSGDPYATFLLGAIVPTDIAANWGGNGNNWDSGATGFPVNIKPQIQRRFYGLYLNDDWKVTRNLTVNLGVRYEYESPFADAQNRETRALDLNTAIPELQGIAMPAEVAQFYTGTWKPTGAFQFADNQHHGAWDGGLGTLSPRIGAAYRLNDKMVIRAAYGRYVTPWTSNQAHDQLSGFALYGFSNYTGAPEAIQGVPQMSLDNPFPSSNPIAPSVDKTLGIYTMLGNSLNYPATNRLRSNSDRVNVSFQRQLPASMLLDVTYFLNRTGQVFETDYNINQVDPNIYYTFKEQTLAVIDNPFAGLPYDKFPGPMRYQPQVDAAGLAKPYPQYGDILVTDGSPGGTMRYQALQLKLQKSYTHGLSLLIGYSYHVEKDQRFFDSIASYDRQYSWQNAQTYRQRLTGAGAWDLPFGKGRPFMNSAPRVLDAVVGGWKLSSVLFWRSGNILGFGGMLWDGVDPKISNPTPQQWFQTSGFQRLPNYTPRTNPWNFSDITGPGVLNMSASFAKDFRITERIKFELKADAFNVFNNMSWGDPSTSVDDSNFGQITNQAGLTFGRRMQLGMRLEF